MFSPNNRESNQMYKKMINEMETGIIKWFMRIGVVSQKQGSGNT